GRGALLDRQVLREGLASAEELQLDLAPDAAQVELALEVDRRVDLHAVEVREEVVGLQTRGRRGARREDVLEHDAVRRLRHLLEGGQAACDRDLVAADDREAEPRRLRGPRGADRFVEAAQDLARQRPRAARAADLADALDLQAAQDAEHLPVERDQRTAQRAGG